MITPQRMSEEEAKKELALVNEEDSYKLDNIEEGE